MKTIKLVGKKLFEIEMIHEDNGKYSVNYSVADHHYQIEDIEGYEIASTIFDKKCDELDKMTQASKHFFS